MKSIFRPRFTIETALVIPQEWPMSERDIKWYWFPWISFQVSKADHDIRRMAWHSKAWSVEPEQKKIHLIWFHLEVLYTYLQLNYMNRMQLKWILTTYKLCPFLSYSICNSVEIIERGPWGSEKDLRLCISVLNNGGVGVHLSLGKNVPSIPIQSQSSLRILFIILSSGFLRVIWI